ncbi:MAG: hypothetical protein PSX80_13825 [bacterium]|nr:hypothetical protein [bacterium]
MQRPQESLHDFLNSIEPQPAPPPTTVSLRPTGEVEVLKPLAVDQVYAKAPNPLLLRQGAPRISWFHRSLIFGGGAAAAVAIIFLSAVFIAISEPSDRASVEGVEVPSYESDAPVDESLGDNSLAPANEPTPTTTANVLTPANASQVFGEIPADRRPNVRSRRSTLSVQRAAHIPRRTPRPADVPSFIPTTLIIYPENGEIKTRIEPTLSAAYKLPITFSN